MEATEPPVETAKGLLSLAPESLEGHEYLVGDGENAVSL